MRVKVKSSGIGNGIKGHAQFEYSLDGKTFRKAGEPFQMKEGKWIGAKLGFFNCRPNKINDGAFLDVDWIRFHT